MNPKYNFIFVQNSSVQMEFIIENFETLKELNYIQFVTFVDVYYFHRKSIYEDVELSMYPDLKPLKNYFVDVVIKDMYDYYVPILKFMNDYEERIYASEHQKCIDIIHNYNETMFEVLICWLRNKYDINVDLNTLQNDVKEWLYMYEQTRVHKNNETFLQYVQHITQTLL